MTRQPRDTQRYRGVRREKDAPLVSALHRISKCRPRAGYRVAAAHLRREGWPLNDKRAQRLWRQEGLKVPRRQCQRRRLGSSENSAQRRRATRINEVWSYDFIFDQTEDGRRLKWLPICDELSRESVALEVERRMDSREVICILDAAVAERGMESAMPVLPLEHSRMVESGLSRRRLTASTRTVLASLSLMQPLGLRNSHFAWTVTPSGSKRNGMSGVLPMSVSTGARSGDFMGVSLCRVESRARV